jgi:hypothetical protein
MSATGETMPGGTPQVLLAHHLKQLKLPTVLREYDKVVGALRAASIIPATCCGWSSWN